MMVHPPPLLNTISVFLGEESLSLLASGEEKTASAILTSIYINGYSLLAPLATPFIASSTGASHRLGGEICNKKNFNGLFLNKDHLPTFWLVWPPYLLPCPLVFLIGKGAIQKTLTCIENTTYQLSGSFGHPLTWYLSHSQARGKDLRKNE